MPLSIGFVAGLVMVGTNPAGAAAGPSTSRLAWDAPAGCSERAEVVAKVEELIGARFEVPREESVQVYGRVVQRAPSWVLTLSLTTSTGTEQRTLETKTCAALVEAAAVVIATAIDPMAIEPPPPPPPDPEPRVEPEAGVELPPRELPPTRPAPNHRRSTTAGFVRAVGGVSVGPLPAVAPLIGLGVGLRRPWLRAELVAIHGFAQDAPSPWGVGRIHQWSAIARICAVPSVRWVEFPLCAGPELGVMTGRGRGVDASSTGQALWGAANLSPGILFVPSPRVGIGLQVDVVVPWSRPGFEIEGGGVVHRADAVGLYALGGFEVYFP